MVHFSLRMLLAGMLLCCVGLATLTSALGAGEKVLVLTTVLALLTALMGRSTYPIEPRR